MELERIKKFNGGGGAILCSACSVIIKEGFVGSAWAEEYHKRKETYPEGLITVEDWASNEPLFCEECKKNENKSIKNTEE